MWSRHCLLTSAACQVAIHHVPLNGWQQNKFTCYHSRCRGQCPTPMHLSARLVAILVRLLQLKSALLVARRGGAMVGCVGIEVAICEGQVSASTAANAISEVYFTCEHERRMGAARTVICQCRFACVRTGSHWPMLLAGQCSLAAYRAGKCRAV